MDYQEEIERLSQVVVDLEVEIEEVKKEKRRFEKLYNNAMNAYHIIKRKLNELQNSKI